LLQRTNICSHSERLERRKLRVCTVINVRPRYPNSVIAPDAPAEAINVDSDQSLHLERGPSRSSWLCSGELDRERMLDMDDRIRPARLKTFAILALAIGSSAPWTGWWPLLFLAPAGAFFAVADRLTLRIDRPELLMFTAWICTELTIAGAVALAGGARIVALSWLAIPVMTLSARFSMRGVVAGLLIAVALVLAVAFGIDARGVVDHPELVLAPLALVLCVAILSTPLMRSDIEHRSDAVIDQLTGMLNRKALSARVHELTQQSAISGEPVGVIVADLDHFKRINDTRGHAAGDAALKEVAYLLRKRLRAFDLAYRLGGEEFLILVPGSDLANTAELAERLREGVADYPVDSGLSVTVSLGVGASARSQRFDYASVFAEADAALYRAKRSGRNRVCAADGRGADGPGEAPPIALASIGTGG
jgi:diguanylate cyclase (GGDEF)-like protein